MKRNGRESHYAICVNNTGYKASLIVRKVYQLKSDPAAERRGLLRAVDESGEDYLFPSQLLIPINLLKSASRAFRVSATVSQPRCGLLGRGRFGGSLP